MTDVIVEVKLHTPRFEPLSELVKIVEDAMSGMQETTKDEFTVKFTWYIRGATPEHVVLDREGSKNVTNDS
jgi:hypothetical protein